MATTKKLLVFLVTLLAGPIAQVAFGQQPVDLVTTSVNEGSNQYRIGPGDQLSIAIFGKAQLSREERVDERGMIRMPLIEEEIRASCRTESELAADIARAYKDRQLLRNPSVTVSVKDFQSQPVAVLGAVNQPGRFLLRRRIRLLELLVFHAGGPTESKAGRKVQIFSTNRTMSCEAATGSSAEVGSSAEAIATYDLVLMLQGNEAMNPYVKPGDIINVFPAEQVIINGQVGRPSTISLLEPTTLGRAIAMVGGVLPEAKKDKIRVLRPVPGNPTATTELLVDLKDKDKTKGEEFLLKGGDIVEVSPKTGFSAFMSNLTKTMIPTLTNLPMYMVY